MFNCCNIYFSFTVILCRKGNVQLLHEDLILKGKTHLKHQSSTRNREGHLFCWVSEKANKSFLSIIGIFVIFFAEWKMKPWSLGKLLDSEGQVYSHESYNSFGYYYHLWNALPRAFTLIVESCLHQSMTLVSLFWQNGNFGLW